MTEARFALIARVESVSWLAMIAATLGKRGFGVDGATAVIGPVHGLVFLGYVAAVALLREELGWSGRRTVVAVISAVIPLGAYLIVERRWLRPSASGDV